MAGILFTFLSHIKRNTFESILIWPKWIIHIQHFYPDTVLRYHTKSSKILTIIEQQFTKSFYLKSLIYFQIGLKFVHENENMDLGKLIVGLVFICVHSLNDVVHCYGTKGDNVSFLLNSFQEGYDRRLRPNYGGESWDGIVKLRSKSSCGIGSLISPNTI